MSKKNYPEVCLRHALEGMTHVKGREDALRHFDLVTYLREFQTIRFSYPRQTGVTTAVTKLFIENVHTSLYVTYDANHVSLLHRDSQDSEIKAVLETNSVRLEQFLSLNALPVEIKTLYFDDIPEAYLTDVYQKLYKFGRTDITIVITT